MKKMMILMLALALGATTAFAQDKKCDQEICSADDFAKQRTEKISRICELNDAQKEAVLALNQKFVQTEDLEEMSAKMLRFEKDYDKALKKIIGRKNFRILKGCDKVVRKAVALNEKIAFRPAKPAKEKKSKK